MLLLMVMVMILRVKKSRALQYVRLSACLSCSARRFRCSSSNNSSLTMVMTTTLQNGAIVRMDE